MTPGAGNPSPAGRSKPAGMRLASALALSLLASGLAAAEGPAAPLTLAQAARRALAGNLGVGLERLGAADALDGVTLAESAFDARLSWSNTLGSSRSLADIDADLPATDTWASELALSQPFSWGGSLRLSGSADRLWADSDGIAGNRTVQAGAGIAYTQPLLRGGWRAVNLAPVVSARLGAGQSRLLLRAATLDLLLRAEQDYWALAASRSLVALRESSLASARSLLDEVSERRRLGTATVQEELQARADVAAQEVAVLGARQQADAADIRLRRTLGMDGADLAELALQPLPEDPVEGVADYRAWLARVLEGDLPSRARRLEVDAAEARVGAARMNDLPSLDLTLAGNANGEPATFGRLNPAMNALPGRHSWDAAASLTLAFPLGFRESESRLRLALRDRRRAELRVADARQALTFDARAAWRDLESARARRESARAGLDLQTRAYEGERARYAAGVTDLPRVLQARASLDAAQFAWVSAVLDGRSAAARVARLDGSILTRLGFTWDDAEPLLGADLGVDDPLPPLSEP